jgi:hypothetical protein
MKKADSFVKVFTVTFPDKSEKYVKNVHTYWIDTELRILYLKDGNGEIIAAFNEWWSFTIKKE